MKLPFNSCCRNFGLLAKTKVGWSQDILSFLTKVGWSQDILSFLFVNHFSYYYDYYYYLLMS